MPAQRIVIKLGTSVLTGGTPRLHQPRMVEIVRQCAALYEEGHELILCSSGAIAAGREAMDFPQLPPTINYKQMLAAIGQTRLMLVWERLFEIYGIRVGQILLTRADVESRQRYLNARDALHTLLEHRVLPIINENDAVATEEIKVGDNDNLSALVATLAEADLLLLLTDLPGLYTMDPRAHPEAELIKEVSEINGSLKAMAGSSVSGLGTGGMATKIDAAEIACRAGTEVIIASGETPEVLFRLISQKETLGTRFVAHEQSLESRKRWLLAGTRSSGSLVVDSGAVRALSEEGRSLLPAGIREVRGAFKRGDTIGIEGEDGDEFARGIARYDADALVRIAGCRSEAIEQELGYAYGPVAVHRNDLLLLH